MYIISSNNKLNKNKEYNSDQTYFNNFASFHHYNELTVTEEQTLSFNWRAFTSMALTVEELKPLFLYICRGSKVIGQLTDRQFYGQVQMKEAEKPK